MLVQILVLILAILSFEEGLGDLFFVAGAIAFLVDLMAILSGKLHLTTPIILSIIGYFVMGSVIEGIMFGSIVGNVFELIVGFFATNSKQSD